MFKQNGKHKINSIINRSYSGYPGFKQYVRELYSRWDKIGREIQSVKALPNTTGAIEDVTVDSTQQVDNLNKPANLMQYQQQSWDNFISTSGIPNLSNSIDHNQNPLGLGTNFSPNTTDDHNFFCENVIGTGSSKIAQLLKLSGKRYIDNESVFRPLQVVFYYRVAVQRVGELPGQRVFLKNDKFLESKSYEFYTNSSWYLNTEPTLLHSDSGADYVIQSSDSRPLSVNNVTLFRGVNLPGPDSATIIPLIRDVTSSRYNAMLPFYIIKVMFLLTDLQDSLPDTTLVYNEQNNKYNQITIDIIDPKDPAFLKFWKGSVTSSNDGKEISIYSRSRFQQYDIALVKLLSLSGVPFELVNNLETEKHILNMLDTSSSNVVEKITIYSEDPESFRGGLANFNNNWFTNRQNLEELANHLSSLVPHRFACHYIDTLLTSLLMLREKAEYLKDLTIDFPIMKIPPLIGVLTLNQPQTFGIYSCRTNIEKFYEYNIVFSLKYDSTISHFFDYIFKNGVNYSSVLNGYKPEETESIIRNNLVRMTQGKMSHDRVYNSINGSTFNLLGTVFTSNLLYKIYKLFVINPLDHFSDNGYYVSFNSSLLGYLGQSATQYNSYSNYINQFNPVTLKQINDDSIINLNSMGDVILNVIYRNINTTNRLTNDNYSLVNTNGNKINLDNVNLLTNVGKYFSNSNLQIQMYKVKIDGFEALRTSKTSETITRQFFSLKTNVERRTVNILSFNKTTKVNKDSILTNIILRTANYPNQQTLINNINTVLANLTNNLSFNNILISPPTKNNREYIIQLLHNGMSEDILQEQLTILTLDCLNITSRGVLVPTITSENVTDNLNFDEQLEQGGYEESEELESHSEHNLNKENENLNNKVNTKPTRLNSFSNDDYLEFKKQYLISNKEKHPKTEATLEGINNFIMNSRENEGFSKRKASVREIDARTSRKIIDLWSYMKNNQTKYTKFDDEYGDKVSKTCWKDCLAHLGRKQYKNETQYNKLIQHLEYHEQNNLPHDFLNFVQVCNSFKLGALVIMVDRTKRIYPRVMVVGKGNQTDLVYVDNSTKHIQTNNRMVLLYIVENLYYNFQAETKLSLDVIYDAFNTAISIHRRNNMDFNIAINLSKRAILEKIKNSLLCDEELELGIGKDMNVKF